MNDYQRELTAIFFLISCAAIFGGALLIGLTNPPIQEYWNSSPSMNARANMLQNLTTEKAYVYLDGIEIASNLTGTIDQVTVPYHPEGNITVLHNHPYQPGLWEGFSFEDLRSARQFNVTQMVLVTQSGIWSTKVPFKEWYFSPF